MTKRYVSAWTIASSMALISWGMSAVQAQLPSLHNLNLPDPSQLNKKSDNPVISGCIRLDGRCLFEITDKKSDLSARIQEIEQRLQDVSDTYFKNETVQLDVRKQQTEGINELNIYLFVGYKDVRLLTITDEDAKLKGVSIETRTNQIIDDLKEGLKQAKKERQPQVLIHQSGIATGTGIVMIIASLAICRCERRSKLSKENLDPSNSLSTDPISTELIQKEKWNLKEVQHRLLQVAQVTIWAGGSLFILNLFPYTRAIQILIVSSFQIPLQVAIVGLSTYVGIRLCYALIDRFSSVLSSNKLLTPEGSRRSQLRIYTISGVTKSIVTFGGISVGLLVALAVTGVNIAPLLAGAGIIGLALSLAFQNLIKDAINGFFIIFEDQYAIGDVIAVADVGGLVENMNLRITQLRDAEGRLITIPNSEIKIVANLSSSWSRADLAIPVSYQTDINQALELIKKVAQEMIQDSIWRKNILDQPEILGVDDFGSRGIIIRVWIKTQPLKQWEVAREFRRLLTVAFDKAGIPISLPQQAVWFNNTLPMESFSNPQGYPDSQRKYPKLD
ncbi:mechanosensitive ion channel family protein [Limnofasciculus baicalensis]|uniref:Mechanosensitive ion channel family protein n=1 Tax=Limnofasciculus baicalensis BBK-W-15 TaxID=2699891 RepID=A0AAE3KRT6_9CYAN|nr:mechanosensitive ion channel family protein [Limnofasciculus baicalensis]MCP2728777.1 mechanosensitive ion channel family protein [Limnofasciculus baicalensis BBK-W-15]